MATEITNSTGHWKWTLRTAQGKLRKPQIRFGTATCRKFDLLCHPKDFQIVFGGLIIWV